MSIGLGVTTAHISAAGQDLNSTSTAFVVPVWKPMNVIRFGFIVDNGTDSGTTLEVSLDKRIDAGTDTGRVELAAFTPTATVTQGDGLWFDLTTRQEVNPGEELVVEVKTAAGVASTGYLAVEVVEYPFQRTSSDSTEDRLANMTEET